MPAKPLSMVEISELTARGDGGLFIAGSRGDMFRGLAQLPDREGRECAPACIEKWREHHMDGVSTRMTALADVFLRWRIYDHGRDQVSAPIHTISAKPWNRYNEAVTHR